MQFRRNSIKSISLGVTQKSWFRRNRFCRVTPAQFIRYLKSFYKASLDINKPLRLWVIIYTLLKFRTFRSAPCYMRDFWLQLITVVRWHFRPNSKLEIFTVFSILNFIFLTKLEILTIFFHFELNFSS